MHRAQLYTPPAVMVRSTDCRRYDSLRATMVDSAIIHTNMLFIGYRSDICALDFVRASMHVLVWRAYQWAEVAGAAAVGYCWAPASLTINDSLIPRRHGPALRPLPSCFGLSSSFTANCRQFCRCCSLLGPHGCAVGTCSMSTGNQPTTGFNLSLCKELHITHFANRNVAVAAAHSQASGCANHASRCSHGHRTAG
jgi:hypothetical protein